MRNVSPNGSSAEVTSCCVAPTVEGTTTRDPGPTNAYQPATPNVTAIPRAIKRFLFTLLLIFLRLATWAVVSFACGTGIAAVSSLIFLRKDFGSFFGRSGEIGRSSSRLSCFFCGFRAFNSSWKTDASRGRSSGFALVAR